MGESPQEPPPEEPKNDEEKEKKEKKKDEPEEQKAELKNYRVSTPYTCSLPWLATYL